MLNIAPQPMLDGHSVVGVPAEDPVAFRKCLGQYGTGVTIVTTEGRDSLRGVTANSFTGVSLDPALILWCLSRNSSSYEDFTKSQKFAVNILTHSQIELAKQFAKSSGDKFANVRWRRGSFGSPLIEGAAAWLECTLAGQYDAGDHVIMVGSVEKFSYDEFNVLLFVQGGFKSV